MPDAVFRLSSAVFVQREGEILLLKRAMGEAVGGWYLPGSAVDPGETVDEGAKRELFEEAGLVASGPLTVVAVAHMHVYGYDSLQVLFACDCAEGDVVISDEHSGFRWMDPQAYRDRYFSDDYPRACRRSAGRYATEHKRRDRCVSGVAGTSGFERREHMKRVLITGMSGTGKSTLVEALVARGHAAVDIDHPDWSEYIDVSDVPEEVVDQDWVWREDRVRQLLSEDTSDVLFISGCASNQGKFYPQFDEIVLLSAPPSVLTERLASRTGNTYGKSPEELALVLHYRQTVEPRLREGATLELDTRKPLDDVVEALLAHVR